MLEGFPDALLEDSRGELAVSLVEYLEGLPLGLPSGLLEFLKKRKLEPPLPPGLLALLPIPVPIYVLYGQNQSRLTNFC